MAEFDFSQAIGEARAKYESISKALDVDRLTAQAKDLEVQAAEPGLCAGWHAAAERYSEFLRRHEGQKILFLELGVGYNTPVIIKYPFWRMTARNPNATYVCINKGEAVCPNEIAKQSLLFDGDIAAVLAQMIREHGFIVSDS